MSGYQPKTGAACTCRPGAQRDNCPRCEGTGQVIDFRAIRNAPLGRTPEKLGRCECREFSKHRKDYEHTHAEEYPTSSEVNWCTRDAVRLVTVRVLLGTRPSGRSRRKAKTWEESREVGMCEPCAAHHEAQTDPSRASHTERTRGET